MVTRTATVARTRWTRSRSATGPASRWRRGTWSSRTLAFRTPSRRGTATAGFPASERPQVSRASEGGKARRSGPSRSCRTGGGGCGSVVAHGLEVVRGCEVRDVRSELPGLHVRGAEVEACPDAGLDDL